MNTIATTMLSPHDPRIEDADRTMICCALGVEIDEIQIESITQGQGPWDKTFVITAVNPNRQDGHATRVVVERHPTYGSITVHLVDDQRADLAVHWGSNRRGWARLPNPCTEGMDNTELVRLTWASSLGQKLLKIANERGGM